MSTPCFPPSAPSGTRILKALARYSSSVRSVAGMGFAVLLGHARPELRSTGSSWRSTGTLLPHVRLLARSEVYKGPLTLSGVEEDGNGILAAGRGLAACYIRCCTFFCPVAGCLSTSAAQNVAGRRDPLA